MIKLKLTILSALFFFALGLSAQEICDNGIDDDGNGLIDLNDSACDCGEVLPLVDTVGYVCKGTLRLIMTDQEAISYQWYKDGVAISGETNALIKVFDTPGFEGLYSVMVTTATGCYTSIPYDAFIPPPIEVDLGIQYVCPPDCLDFGPFTLCSPGDFQNNGIAANGCDSITYLEVRVGNSSSSSFSDAICAGQTYTYYDLTATETGVYQTIIPNNFGCDSVVTINLTVEPEIPASTNASICSGETYTFQDITATTTGAYQTIVTGNGDCDTLLTVNLTVVDPVQDTIYPSICSGATYMHHDITATVSGEYSTTLSTDAGCDSTLVVFLTVNDPVSEDIDARICDGDTYTLHSISATESGVYSTTISNGAGCDSTINVTLTVDNPITSNMEASFCEGENYVFYDINTSVGGEFSTVFTAANGCDSTVYVDVTMLENSETFLEEYVCEGNPYILYDIYATESGQYTTTISNSVGCDSIITVDLVVTDTVKLFFAETICNGDTVVVRDTEYFDAGDYTIEIMDNFGCDTVITVTIDVLSETYSEINASICEGETYDLNGSSTDVAGVYQSILTNAVGCDSIVTVNLSVLENTMSTQQAEICEGDTYEYYDISTMEAGSYETTIPNAAGCDSVITVELTVNPLLRREVAYTLCDGDVLTVYGLNATATEIIEVRQSNATGCDSLITIDLVVNTPEDLLELGEDIDMDLGETIDIIPEFIASDLENLEWYDENGNYLGNQTTLTNYKPLVDTRVYLSGTDSNGCSVVDDILVRVTLNVKVYFPNIFSPNDDGSNDEFIFKFNEAVIAVEEVLIFDRWGEHIYTTRSNTVSEGFMGWDGTFNGQDVNSGVYVYLVKLNIIDGSTRSYSGDITVVR